MSVGNLPRGNITTTIAARKDTTVTVRQTVTRRWWNNETNNSATVDQNQLAFYSGCLGYRNSFLNRAGSLAVSVSSATSPSIFIDRPSYDVEMCMVLSW